MRLGIVNGQDKFRLTSPCTDEPRWQSIDVYNGRAADSGADMRSDASNGG